MIGVTAHGDELTVTSPDQRYSIIFRHSNGESFLPDTYLHESLTGDDLRLAGYAPIKKGSSRFNALWSPDSRHVAVTLTGLPGLNGVQVWRIGVSPHISMLEILPLPKAIDTKKTSFVGGTSAHSWEGNEILWISDRSKNRLFRYRLTKNRKMLADAFEELPKKPAEKNADGKTPETPQSPH